MFKQHYGTRVKYLFFTGRNVMQWVINNGKLLPLFVMNLGISQIEIMSSHLEGYDQKQSLINWQTTGLKCLRLPQALN